MVSQRQLLDLNIPPWALRTLRVLGLTTVIDGVVRYTFFGELIEHLLERTLGEGRYVRMMDRASK